MSERRNIIAAAGGEDTVYTVELSLVRFDGDEDPVVEDRRLLMTTLSEAYAYETLIGLTRKLTGGGAGIEG